MVKIERGVVLPYGHAKTAGEIFGKNKRAKRHAMGEQRPGAGQVESFLV
jgi:hypothetical protein